MYYVITSKDLTGMTTHSLSAAINNLYFDIFDKIEKENNN
jgi:hypothetical protein